MWRSERTRAKSLKKQGAITRRGGQKFSNAIRRIQEHANDSGGAEGEGGEGTEGKHNTPTSQEHTDSGDVSVHCNDAVDDFGQHNDDGYGDPRNPEPPPKVFSRELSVNGKENSDHAFVLMFCENWDSTQARKSLWKKTRTTSTLLVVVAVVSVMTQVSASKHCVACLITNE